MECFTHNELAAAVVFAVIVILIAFSLVLSLRD